jgi:beta-1,4-mannosyltransferase
LDWTGAELLVSEIPNTYTPFTKTTNSLLSMSKNRPALICSSTSWTEDEDFSLLIEALEIYDQRPSSRMLYVVITGKGPMKKYYMDYINSINFTKVVVKSCWLDQQDYPTLIACCDLGISLHTSSSGLDLPMKIVDLFGCGVPVCAVNFER